jgi:hypothetical protein
VALFEQKIGKFKKGDFMRDDHGYKELREQALQMMIQCDKLIDAGPNVTAKRSQVIHTIQRVWNKFESKVLVHEQQLYDNNYSIAV